MKAATSEEVAAKTVRANRLLSCALIIVPFTGNGLALPILRLLDATRFRPGNFAVGARFVFHALNARLVFLQARCLSFSQVARLHALVDALLLIGLPLVDTRAGRRPSRALIVVSFASNGLALTILRLLDTARFLSADLAVGACLIFHALYARLVLLQSRRFALGQVARFNALVNALLLIGLALVDTCARSVTRVLRQRDAR
jgi:hypothetical protein